MDHSIQIRKMKQEDISNVYKVFREHDIRKPFEYIEQCWKENQTGNRITLLAFHNEDFAGSLHLLARAKYPCFVENGIPEINDFNVIKPFRRLGIGNQLMEYIEQIAFEKYGVVGVGVGMHIHYGQAQRLYAKRGYIPDGRGLTYHNNQLNPGVKIYADDDLILYMIKNVKESIHL
ncbi:GNAT family N-acetyltransferase [Shimazuella kribbensis]|uniref:GNAT family N-acetyltransferase n=1 Tax=Shimazuella kribbensis TaxID=139808 RepID=UPI000426F540|nr:GNAT family N-acetyltransferase [Shimazuella kribbensis]